MTHNVSSPDVAIHGSSGRAPQSVWSLVVNTLALYGRFWKEFVFAPGSVAAAIWVAIGLSIAVGHDFRELGVVPVLIGVLAWYYALVLLTVIASQASQNGTVSLAQAYRESLLGLATSVGALAGMASLMAGALIVPFIGLVAALYLYLRLSVGFELAILHRLNPIRAVRRAWSLTKGRFRISLLHALLQHGYLLALTMVLVLSPHVAIAVALIVVALPVFSIARVLSYLDLQERQRVDTAPSHYTNG